MMIVRVVLRYNGGSKGTDKNRIPNIQSTSVTETSYRTSAENYLQ